MLDSLQKKESNSDEIMPEVYHKFFGTGKDGYIKLILDKEKALKEDLVYKISLGLYFHAACELRENGKRYNLNKIKHELNSRK